MRGDDARHVLGFEAGSRSRPNPPQEDDYRHLHLAESFSSRTRWRGKRRGRKGEGKKEKKKKQNKPNGISSFPLFPRLLHPTDSSIFPLLIELDLQRCLPRVGDCSPVGPILPLSSLRGKLAMGPGGRVSVFFWTRMGRGGAGEAGAGPLSNCSSAEGRSRVNVGSSLDCWLIVWRTMSTLKDYDMKLEDSRDVPCRSLKLLASLFQPAHLYPNETGREREREQAGTRRDGIKPH
ncbi:hypothetical protein LX36DRAFT_189202 [Colletotrichum falcatum]|nr:hypothetical protein LX36DRAFT_189202 [Colletotrichum falcatum]